MSKITNKGAMDAIRQRRETLMANAPSKVAFDRWQVDGKPFECFVKPLTLLEHDAIVRAREVGQAEGRSGRYDMFLATIIHRARNEDGSPIFSENQMEELRKHSLADDIIELSSKITAASPTEEEVEGN